MWSSERNDAPDEFEWLSWSLDPESPSTESRVWSSLPAEIDSGISRTAIAYPNCGVFAILLPG